VFEGDLVVAAPGATRRLVRAGMNLRTVVDEALLDRS
jgi:hypothetical protein